MAKRNNPGSLYRVCRNSILEIQSFREFQDITETATIYDAHII